MIGGITYFRNAFDANGTDEQALGLSAQIISDFEQIFVDPDDAGLHAATWRANDRQFDRLAGRPRVADYGSQAVGLPPVPIIAPSI